MYDTSKLPKQYEAPKMGPKPRIDRIMKLLGFWAHGNQLHWFRVIIVPPDDKTGQR